MSKEFPWQFSDSVWMLGNEGYPFFLVAGTKACALVEGSLSCMTPMAMAQMESLNLNVPLKYLVVAHEHSDHVCGFVKLKERKPELILAGSKTAANILAKAKVMAKFVGEDQMFGKVLHDLKMADQGPENLEPAPLELDMLIKDGQVLDLGGVEIRAISTPGHSPGSFSYMIEPDKTLLMSDAAGLGKNQTENYPMFFYSFKEYVDSLERLRELEPERLALAHDYLVDGKQDCQDFLKMTISASYAMQEDMKNQEKAGRSHDEIALDWAQRMKKFGMFDLFPDEALVGYTSLLLRRALEA